MKGLPRSSRVRARDLPGIKDLLEAPTASTQLGFDWAVVVFCTFGAPPALMLAGLLHRGSSPVTLWLAACALFFTGLVLSLRLRPLPPRPVFDPTALAEAEAENGVDAFPISMDLVAFADPSDASHDVGTSEWLERLAKLREQGELSNSEYEAALARVRQSPSR